MMGKGGEMDKRFSEELDRILAGEEIKLDQSMDDDLRSTLDFASKMVQYRETPSSQFKSSLKAQLLHKLAEREAAREKKRSWVWRLIPSQPVWQATAVVFFIIIIGSIMWGSGLFRTLMPAPVTTSTTIYTTATSTTKTTITTGTQTTTTAVTSYTATTTISTTTTTKTTTATSPVHGVYLSVDASTDKSMYLPGEPVRIDVSLRNVTTQPFTLDQFPPIVSLMQTGTRQPVYTFHAGNQSRTLAPNETAYATLVWDQTDNAGRPVLSGAYYVELEELYLADRSIPLNLNKPVNINIVPDAAVNPEARNIDINQSLSVNGISVTLVRIVSSPDGFSVVARISPPPDYAILPGTSTPVREYRAGATYSFDGAWVKDAGVSWVEYGQDGMEHTWYIPEPVPTDSSGLDFIINYIGDWYAPWQFHVNLK
jgi:hypothetical protein